SVRGEDGLTPDGGGSGEPAMTKNYNSSKSNTSSVRGEDGLTPDGGGSGEPAMTKNYNSSKSNTSSVRGEDGLTPDGGGSGEPAMTKNYNSSKSNTSSVSHSSGDSGAVDHNSARSNSGSIVSGGGGGSGSGTGVIGSTFGLAKTILTAAVLLTAAGVGFDLYETYNDAIDLNLEDHVTDADFALNGDKTEINGDISFNIPEMGRFEKKILAQVHVTVLESSPTTDGDYSFEYTLGSGEQTYEFSLTDLDPVTVGKINAGEDLELEYTTSITVIYLGVELAPATTDMPARIVTVETA
ncbi:MAG: hypothetical protein QGG57_02300, partial [Candidatus Poseidoniia archaeon]|nr:hypothetical protein [Candidatus Poseidoniia archaeon]